MKAVLFLVLLLTQISAPFAKEALTVHDLVPLLEEDKLTLDKLEEIIKNSKTDEELTMLNLFASMTAIDTADTEYYVRQIEMDINESDISKKEELEETLAIFKSDFHTGLSRLKFLSANGIYANQMGEQYEGEDGLVTETAFAMILSAQKLKCSYETIKALYKIGEDNFGPAMFKIDGESETPISRKQVLAQAYGKADRSGDNGEACQKASLTSK